MPEILSILPREDWNVFADLLYAYHSETDAWPLVLWGIQQRTRDDSSMNDEKFHDMVGKRNLFNDLTVKWNRALLEEFYTKAKATYQEFNNFDTEEEKSKICDLISLMMRFQAEADPADVPVMLIKTGALFTQYVGLGDDILDSTHFFWLDIAIIPIIKNPTLVGLDDLNYVRPAKSQNLLDECARLIHRYGYVKRDPIGEPYQSVMEHWATVARNAVPHQFSMENAERMERIYRAQNTPNPKKIKKLEEDIRNSIEENTEGYADTSSSISEYGSGKFRDKLNDSRWKPGKEDKGVTQFSWLGDGVATRVDAIMKGDVNIIRKIVEQVFRDMKLFSKQEIEDVDKDTSMLQFRVNSPFPFSPRYVSADVQYHMTSSSESSAVIYDSDRRATPSGHQRAKMETSGVYIMRKERNSVVVSVMIHLDMRSSVPNWALSSQSSALKKNSYKMMKARA